jgi:hypothetical protein
MPCATATKHGKTDRVAVSSSYLTSTPGGHPAPVLEVDQQQVTNTLSNRTRAKALARFRIGVRVKRDDNAGKDLAPTLGQIIRSEGVEIAPIGERISAQCLTRSGTMGPHATDHFTPARTIRNARFSALSPLGPGIRQHYLVQSDGRLASRSVTARRSDDVGRGPPDPAPALRVKSGARRGTKAGTPIG